MSRIKLFAYLIFSLLTLVCPDSVYAAASFSVAQTSPAAPVQFDMSTAQSTTYTVTNTSNGGDANRRLFQVQFQLPTTCTAPCTLTTFSSSTGAPAGWSVTAVSSSSITFKATSWASAISTASGGGAILSQAFALVLVTGTYPADLTQSMAKVNASLSSRTNFSKPRKKSLSAIGSWKAMSLSIVSFQTTDPTTGLPISVVNSGNPFNLVITVKNNSSVTQSGVISVASPPAATKVGTVTLNSPGASPGSLTLASKAQATLTFAYTTAVADIGTVFFTAFVRNNTSSATSRTAVSNTLAVSKFAASIAITSQTLPAACLFQNTTAKFAMTVLNSTPATVTNVIPKNVAGTANTLTITTANGASIGALSGPTAVCSAGSTSLSLATGGNCVFTWTANASVPGGFPTDGTYPSFFARGFASATSGGTINSPVATSNTQTIIEYPVSLSPNTVTASSTNVELDFNIANLGCTNISSVALTSIPAGWVVSTDVTYFHSLVRDTTGNLNDTWVPSGNTSTAPNASSQIPVGNLDNDFYLLFSQVPNTTGTSTFTVAVTDINGVTRTQNVTVTIVDLVSGANVSNSTWKELFP